MFRCNLANDQRQDPELDPQTHQYNPTLTPHPSPLTLTPHPWWCHDRFRPTPSSGMFTLQTCCCLQRPEATINVSSSFCATVQFRPNSGMMTQFYFLPLGNCNLCLPVCCWCHRKPLQRSFELSFCLNRNSIQSALSHLSSYSLTDSLKFGE